MLIQEFAKTCKSNRPRSQARTIPLQMFDMCNYTFLSKDWLQSLSLGHYTAALLEWCEAGDAIQSVAKRLCGSLKEVKKR